MTDRRIYELVNPSDAITFRATPIEAAFIADRMRAGPYFVKDAETGESPSQPENIQCFYDALWCDAAQIQSYAEAYASFLVGSPRDRRLFDEIVAGMSAEQRKARRDKWHDERCTSLNDICRQCWEAAERIAATAPETSEVAQA